MLRLTWFELKHEFAFINNQANQVAEKPMPMGHERTEWFTSKDEAQDAARESGYWIDGDWARVH